MKGASLVLLLFAVLAAIGVLAMRHTISVRVQAWTEQRA